MASHESVCDVYGDAGVDELTIAEFSGLELTPEQTVEAFVEALVTLYDACGQLIAAFIQEGRQRDVYRLRAIEMIRRESDVFADRWRASGAPSRDPALLDFACVQLHATLDQRALYRGAPLAHPLPSADLASVLTQTMSRTLGLPDAFHPPESDHT